MQAFGPEEFSERETKAELLKSARLMAPVRLSGLPASERSPTFREDRALLERLFPRGRLRVNESGEPCLVPRGKALDGWELTVNGPTSVVIYWLGNRPRLERAIEGLKQAREEVVGVEGLEGFVYLEAVPELAERLPMFSKGLQRSPTQFKRDSSSSTSADSERDDTEDVSQQRCE